MANYWITNNAKFRPFSYDEMIKPVEKMYTEHSKIEEGLSELQVKAGIWEGLANQQSDPETYAQYKRYADELKLAANDLAMNGLNARSRQGLYNMKARYASEITPIEQTYQRRDELEKEQRRLKVQDPTLMFDNDFSTVSLDELRRNPRLSYSGISGTAVSARASAMLNNLAKGIETDPQYKSILNGQYFQVTQRNGLTTAQVLALSQNNPEVLYSMARRDDKGNILESDKNEIENIMRIGSTIRGTIHDSLKSNSAYSNNIAGIDAAINEGLLTSGVGGISYSTLGDQSYIDPAKALSMAHTRQSMSIAAENQKWAREDREAAKTPLVFDDGTMLDPRDATGGKIPYKVENGRRKYITGTTAGSKSKSGSSSGSSGESGTVSRLSGPVRIGLKGGAKNGAVVLGPHSKYSINNATGYKNISDIENLGSNTPFDALTENQKVAVIPYLQGDNKSNYDIYVYNEINGNEGTSYITINPRSNVKETKEEDSTFDPNIN